MVTFSDVNLLCGTRVRLYTVPPDNPRTLICLVIPYVGLQFIVVPPPLAVTVCPWRYTYTYTARVSKM